jgi:hypothetical protein
LRWVTPLNSAVGSRLARLTHPTNTKKRQRSFVGATHCVALHQQQRIRRKGRGMPRLYTRRKNLRRGDACVALDQQPRMRREGESGSPKNAKRFLGCPAMPRPYECAHAVIDNTVFPIFSSVVHLRTLFSLTFPGWLRLRKLASIAENCANWLHSSFCTAMDRKPRHHQGGRAPVHYLF